MAAAHAHLLGALLSVKPDKAVAWAATCYCLISSARVARLWLTKNPRLFTVVALFALHWAILLPYYGTAINSESLPAFGGFLSVYIGVLLCREAKQNNPELYVRREYIKVVPENARSLVQRLINGDEFDKFVWAHISTRYRKRLLESSKMDDHEIAEWLERAIDNLVENNALNSSPILVGISTAHNPRSRYLCVRRDIQLLCDNFPEFICEKNENANDKVDLRDRLALYWLAWLVFPSMYSLSVAAFFGLQKSDIQGSIEATTASAMAIIGYFYTLRGLSLLVESAPTRRAQRLLSMMQMTVYLYAAAEVAYTVWYLYVAVMYGAPGPSDPTMFWIKPSTKPMIAEFRYLYAVCKLTYNALFLLIIVNVAIKPEDNLRRNWLELALSYIGWA